MAETHADALEWDVELTGIKPIMFDRYLGEAKKKAVHPPEQRLYLGEDGRTVCLPGENVFSFLSAINTKSVAKMLCGKTSGTVSQAVLSFVDINPLMIPFLRDGKPVKFHGFKNGVDKGSGIFVHRCVARLKTGVPNEKIRAVLPLPWSLAMEVRLVPTGDLDETLLYRMFEYGGLRIGFGTYRGLYGKFEITRWDARK